MDRAKPGRAQACASEGLTAGEAADLLRRHGPNQIPRGSRTSAFRVLLRQFTDLLVLILIAAAAIAFFLGEKVETAAIMLVVAINALLGFVQEWRAESALAALGKMLAPSARVRRDGQVQSVPAREVVPGDIVLLEAGERVPADLDLDASAGLRMDESALTGESVPVDKGPQDPVFMGTSVVAGHAEGTVIATGSGTEFGQVAHLTGSVADRPTSLQVQLGRTARQLALAAVLIGAAVAALGLIAGRGVLEMFMTALSLAVAIVPEGLPVVVTLTLALGAIAMVRRRALVRQLQAVETLGAASAICTDKTGTLTENRMTATEISTAGGTYHVTGTGYDPEGHIAHNGKKRRAADDPALSALLDAAILCNNATLERTAEGWSATGAPTEAALVTLAYKGWAEPPEPGDVIEETPFSSERKRMAVLARRDGETRLYVKGAPEAVIELSHEIMTGAGPRFFDTAARQGVLASYRAMASDGLRVIALASRRADEGDMIEEGLVLLGLVGLLDPPRAEVRDAVASCAEAGIRIFMITGDSPETARAIARKIGLRVEAALTGKDVEDMDDGALADALRREVLFARTAPAHKLRIVKALQADGEIVAMTGDGVNDAPALKQADIGVAMGQRGTEVARDASDLVLLDDNFATIVHAIEEGRRQFGNLRKFVRYLLSSNAGEVLAIAANLMIGGPLIFLAPQILWINLVTDGLSAVALGLERAEPGQMRQPPRGRNAPILGRAGLAMILGLGLYSAAASLWIFYALVPEGTGIARSAAFTAMVIFEIVAVFAFRSFQQPCSRIGWFSNRFLIAALAGSIAVHLAAVYLPLLQHLLRTEALNWSHWGLIVTAALPLVLVPEAIKFQRGRVRAG